MSDAADYVIVGSGLTGATLARLLRDAGHDVIVVESRSHIGGNVADGVHPCGIRYNYYGPHYFRTSSPRIRAFAEQFASFYSYAAIIQCQVGNALVGWPLQRSTFERFAGDAAPVSEVLTHHPTTRCQPSDKDARQNKELELSSDRFRSEKALEDADNFETAMLSLVPRHIYDMFIRGYSEKQWGVPPASLDSSLAKRIDVRDDGDARLSKASFQALPEGGYTGWVAAMLDGIDVWTSTDFHDVASTLRWKRKLIYTGPIDRYFDYRYGPLPYRAQDRVDIFIPGQKFVFACGQTNLPSPDEGRHVRTIEWRHMLAPGEGPPDGTLLTLEIPTDAADWRHAEYPFPSHSARQLYDRYAALASEHSDILFCGRLGEYRYLDMDQAIGRAMLLADRLIAEC